MPKAERVAALAAGLRVAGASERETLAQSLIATAAEAGEDDASLQALHAVLCAWPTLSADARVSALRLGVGPWSRLANALVRGETEPLDPASVAQFLDDAPWPQFSGCAVWLLEHGEAGETRNAEHALLAMASFFAPSDISRSLLLPPPEGADAKRDGLQGIELPQMGYRDGEDFASDLADAAWAYGAHGRSGPILAALSLLDGRLENDQLGGGVDRLRRLLDAASHPASSAALRCLRRSNAPGLRARAWAWVGLDAVARSAIDRVAQAKSEEDHAGVLRAAHLALRPRRADAARVVEVHADRAGENGPVRLRAGGPLPPPEVAAKLGTDARRGLERLVGSFRTPPAAARVIREPWLADADGLVRLAGARAARGADLHDYLFDPAEPVARSAMLAWSRADHIERQRWPLGAADHQRERLADLLMRSPHAAVRGLARDERRMMSPWNAGAPASRLLARRFRERDPAGFRREALARLESGDAHTVMSTLGTIVALGAVQAFSEQVRALARLTPAAIEGGERVAATAARMLDRLRPDESRPAIVGALSHGDPRVRANAVEAAAGAWGREAGEAVLVEMKSDPHHRVRGNALRAMLDGGGSGERLYQPAAIEQLMSMLDAEQPLEQAAALWSVERVLSRDARSRLGPRWADLAERTATLAGARGDSRIARRARRAAMRIAHDLDGAPSDASARARDRLGAAA